MAIRRSHKWLKAKKNRRQRGAGAQRHSERGLRIEPLEDRVLLSAGPQLVGIQPNVGELLTDNQIRHTAPRDLTFLFNSVANIDPTSLPTDESQLSPYDSIQITRSGLDGTFETASVFSDFNTAGAVQLELTALASGTAGSLVTLSVDKADLGDGVAPTITVQGQQIQATLNVTVGSETTARQLVTALNADPAASQLVTARIRSGGGATDIATPDITYSPLVMDAANSASAVTNLNTQSGLAVKFTAASPGQDGNGIMLTFSKGDLGDGAVPEVSVNGKTIAVVLNTNINTPTTAQQLVDTINADSEAGALVRATIPAGATDTDLSLPVINYSPIVLGGANDIRVQPGYLDFGDSQREVIVRFQETLPDDVYQIEVLGNGPTPLQSIDGAPFNDGQNFVMQFQLDLGAQIVSVVPQPIERTETGALIQRRDQLVVYFNNDDLNPDSAEDPRYYQLIHTAETVINQDNVILNPVSVQYDSGADTAVLTFAQALDSLIDPVTGVLLNPGTLRLRIGTDEAQPLPPREISLGVDPGSSFDTAMDLANQWDTGSAIKVLLNGDAFAEGQTLTLTDSVGITRLFEFDSGFTIQVPAAGASTGGIADGQTFTLDNGTPVVFEFDNDNTVSSGNVAISFTVGDSADVLADAIVTAIAGSGLGLTPMKLPGAAVHVGGDAGLVLDTTASALTQSGEPGAQTAGATAIVFVPSDSFTRTDIAASITSAVNSATFGVTASQDGELVRLDGDIGTRLSLSLTGLKLVAEGLLVNAEIQSPMYPVDYPGGDDEPGHRDIPRIEDHLMAGADGTAGPSTFFYNFQDEYGIDPVTFKPLHNAITANEKQRTREIFDFYSRYLGTQFIESDSLGFTIVTGDLRAVDPTVPTGPGGVAGIAGGGLAVMDLADFSNPGDDQFGGPWFQTAMHEIGHLLGLGHTYDLPPLTIMGDEAALSFGQTAESVFPGDMDIDHGQFLYRPDSNDIDMYRFDLTDTGIFSAETIAERQVNPSLLDTVLTLYKANIDATGRVLSRELISHNDDYFSHDSYLEMELLPGTYYVGISASGNGDYDPAIEQTGTGGRSQGAYQLRFNFRPSADNMMVDTTNVPVDGDADGVPGGVYNFWFRTAAPAGVGDPAAPQTWFVDKAAPAGGDGTLGSPFNRIPAALATARPNDIVRLVGNAGAGGDIATVDDNLAYQIGFSRVGGAVLEDGSTLEVPQGVTVMIDANAILKLRRARIGVGSSAQGLDRSAGALQILGTPRLLDAAGNVILDDAGRPVAGSVYFTSLHDDQVGQDNNPDQTPPAARPGDWGGIVFRNDLDIADSDRLRYADAGIFLNYVNHAEMTYGGGTVFINGVSQVVTPIQMTDDRPTVSFNTIRLSADAAMSANPDSFEEDNFNAPKFQRISFTSDYNRVGPEIHNNTVVDNSLNGLFIRIATPAGQDLEPLAKSARWNDTDIVHIVAENLVIQGQPGGLVLEQTAPAVNLVKLTALTGGTLDANQYDYKLVFVDSAGNEGPASNATAAVDIAVDGGAILLQNLPTLREYPQYTSRRIYRSVVGSGRYELVAEINAEDTSFNDAGSSQNILLRNNAFALRARFDARLAIDPGTIVKLDRARINAGFGSQLIAEGLDGQPIVFTSINDARYGFGGTFDTNLRKGVIDPVPGDWAGLYLGHLSRASLDYSVIAFGGGTTKIEGTFAGFNSIEIHQSETRITRSTFEFNADGSGGLAPPDRYGRGSNDSATIFVRGAQPVIIANSFVDNNGAVISINANALNSTPLTDMGRQTGAVDLVAGFQGNEGPLVRLNRLNSSLNDGSTINGMTVRGGTMTTQGVWDDTDIVHIVHDTIYVPDFHTSGGLRLESNPRESLVVKLQGPTAGFTATGRELDITDRIGGSLQIVGQPRSPVILTSISDDSVGAGYTSDGVPQNDTNGNGSGEGSLPTGSVGDWQGITIDEFANDRNVDVVTEREPRDSIDGADNNQNPSNAQSLGSLASSEKSGDEELRLGFEIHGVLSEAGDVDVYSFQADAGTEVWFDIDQTSNSLDTVVELVDGDGNILVQSDNTLDEELGNVPIYVNSARVNPVNVHSLRKSATDFYPTSALGQPKDLFSTNPRDAGMRVVLPGSLGTTNLYYIRVRSSNLKPGEDRVNLQDPAKVGDGLTAGIYRLQVRLSETDEVPGTKVQYADIRYAVNGISVYGQPTHSPLQGEAAEDSTTNNAFANAQPLGNLLNSDRGALSVAGDLSASNDIDFYQFDITYDSIQNITGFTNAVQHLSTIMDVDYADGLGRPNTRMNVFDSSGNLVMVGTDSNIADDQPAALKGVNTDDLSRGSAGTMDPYIGTQELPVGTYYVAISSDAVIPREYEQFFEPVPANSLFRLEPADGVQRIVEDHINTPLRSTSTAPQIPVLFDNASVVPYTLGDVALYVSTEVAGLSNARLYTVDPFTGQLETTVGYNSPGNITNINRDIEDIAMKEDGTLHAFSLDVENAPRDDAGSGNYLEISTNDSSTTNLGDDGITTWQANTSTPPGDVAQNIGYQFLAMTYGNKNIYQDNRLFAVGYKTQLGLLNSYNENVLFQFNADTGAAVSSPAIDRGGCGNPGGCRYVGAGTNVVERGYLDTVTDTLNQTDRWLITEEATAVDTASLATQSLISDGTSLAVDHDANPATSPVRFELNSGPDIQIHPNPANGFFLRDGDTFSLDGIDYEFDTGSVIVVQASNGGQVSDGELITLVDSTSFSTTFEFDKDGGVAGSNIAIPVNNTMQTAQLVTQLVAGINGAPGLGVVAQAIAGSNRITLLNESNVTGAISTAASVVISGAPGGTAGTLIRVEENFDTNQLGQAIVATFNGPTGVPGITAGLDGHRVNFSGALLGDFTPLAARNVVTDMGGDGSVAVGTVGIAFLAEDTGEVIATRISTALNGAGIAATTNQSAVELTSLATLTTFASADTPLLIAGAPSGGSITGIAMQGTTMYAVTDTGGLFRIDNPSSPRFATAVYLPTSAQDLAGIRFQALSFGPAATENGDLANVLFGMDRSGRLYAFDTLGHLVPAFVDGQTSVSTGLGSVHGIAFSTLEDNPWQIASGTHFRPRDAGHGVEPTFDLSRPTPAYPVDGNSSFVFGRGDNSNYDFPGGAFGSLESHPFSLEGYSPEDKPALYFSYFAETEEESSDPATQTPMYDSLRVFIGDDSGEWTLLATNNSYRTVAPTLRSELTYAPNLVQEVFDNNTGWRQVRVPLDNYAGLDDVKIRIDFSTAGTMNVGDPTTVGVDLRIAPAAGLADGETFSIDGRVFEIDLGYTLLAPSGAAINEGDWFKITDDKGQSVTFEFDADGSVAAGAVPVAYNSIMTPEEIANGMAQAINGAMTTTNPAGVTQLNENRVNLPTTILASTSPGSDLAISGSVGTTGIPVRLHSGMPLADVVAVVRQAIANTFADGAVDTVNNPKDEIIRVVWHQVGDAGPFGLTDQLPGDILGDYYSSHKLRENQYEGIYVDDFIIGFTERGEMATGQSGITTFYDNPQVPDNQILVGAYQLEIRQGEQYGDSLDGPPQLALFRTFDTNDRLIQGHTLIAPPAEQLSDGQTFTLSDGVDQLTFEFEDTTLNDGVQAGHVLVPFNPAMFDAVTGGIRPQTAAEVAVSIRDAINSTAAQAVLDITASLADGTNSPFAVSTSNVINLNGNVDTQLISRSLVATPSADANQMRDAILGDLFTPVGDATYTGGGQSSGFFSSGGSSIGIESGIVLTTGDVQFVEGPNSSDGSTGFASQQGDADLDAVFAPFVTEDTSSLEFSFHVDQTTDLMFEFVFSSEEYNEFVNSPFNDVFAFLIDGENLGLLPGTTIPVSINTINGGNPFGFGGANPHFYNNNDLNDGAPFAAEFGHDGFTDVLVARKDSLAPGDHTIKLAISDVGDQVLDSAVFIRAFNDFSPDNKTQIGGVVYDDRGDQNLERDQGQIVIHSNRISNSAQFGLVVDAAPRSPEGKPHSGPARVTRAVNNLDLVPGVVASNNLIYRNGAGGIDFSGDPNAGTNTTAPVPFGRIVNNTISGGGVGIAVHDNASPTLLNNIVADTDIGIDIDGSSSTTIVGGMVYAGVTTRATNGAIGLGEFPLTVASSRELFVNKDLDNYYLSPNAVAIDSSIDSLQDRAAMVTVRNPLGIDPSPILAPDLDLYGQRRVDDPDVATPSGLGNDVFKDRGAIDRSDFAGPSAVLITPRDNDAAGLDVDVRDSYVKVVNQTLFNFSIQLLDGVQPSNQSNGTGADASTLLPETVALTRDGVLLEEGVEYRFSFDSTSSTIRLTPLAGIWEPDHAYEIQLLNQDVVVVTAESGELIADGDSFSVTDANGLVVPFEFDSGYTMQVPANGGADITDASVITITVDATDYRFEFDDNGFTQPSSIAIPFSATDTPEQVADAIVAAIIGANIGLTPVHPGDGFVQLGGASTTVLDTSGTTVTQAGLPGVTAGSVAIPFTPHVSFDATQVAAAVTDAINSSSLAGVTARAQLNTVVVIGAQSVQGIGAQPIRGISDLAGNILQPNRFDGTTAFTVLLGTGFDFGDAPDPTYPVLRASNGAQHRILEGYMLGATIFASVDGQPSIGADADPGDDGVKFTGFTTGYDTSINVTATGVTALQPGYLDAWIDFNGDGDWNDAGEKIADSVALIDGPNNVSVHVPANAAAGDTHARFRLSSAGGLSPGGSAADGEVEDYRIVINANPWQNSADPLDVNMDGHVTPLDALLIINRINFFGTGPLPNPPSGGFTPPPFFDVDGDGHLAPIDALLVINYLNSPGGSGEGEGESLDGGLAGAAGGWSLTGPISADMFGGQQLVMAGTLGTEQSRATTDVADATQPDALGALYTGMPAQSETVTDLRPELFSGQFRGEQMDDLLGEIADEIGQNQKDAGSIDAFFARYDV